jgi:hypothetical protein
MREFSLLEFATFLPHLAAEVVVAEVESLKEVALVVEKEAKDAIGEYQAASGPFTAWAELADSTKADRVAHGFSENDPELRTGELRNSIEHYVHRRVPVENWAEVGSNSDIMVYQELGTWKMPPRSILGGAAARKEKEVVEILGAGAAAALIGKRAPRITVY